MGQHSEEVPLSVLDPEADGDSMVLVRFRFYPGAPERGPSYDHGGLPAEGPEFSVESAFHVWRNGTAIPLGVSGEDCEKLEEWLAENWEPPSGPDPDEWRDRRRDEPDHF
jgi:hypothetical protein